MNRYLFKNNSSGFTLIELLISFGIFMIFLIGATGVFSRATFLQRRAFAVEQIQSTVLAATEAIARDARVSAICPAGTSCNINKLDIVHPTRGSIIYQLDSSRGVLIRTESGITADFSSIDIEFTRFDFLLSGEGSISDCRQPKITTVISAQNKEGHPQISINTQTTVTSRDIEQEFLNPPGVCP